MGRRHAARVVGWVVVHWRRIAPTTHTPCRGRGALYTTVNLKYNVELYLTVKLIY